MNQETETTKQEPEVTEKPEPKAFPVPANLPYMTQKRFAEHVGVTPRTVEMWVAREYVPTTRVGRFMMINLVKLNNELSGSLQNQGGAK